MNGLINSFVELKGWLAPLGLIFALGGGVAPVWAQAQQISCGQTATGNLAFTGQTDAYTFDAVAGEAVDIFVLPQTTNMNAVADLYDPPTAGSAASQTTSPARST
jgi:hypothetical protein